MILPFSHFFKRTKWGIGISGFTWWFAASTPPLPLKHQWVALCFLPWLLWALPYHRFIRSATWPAIIAVTILFRNELHGVMLLTQLFLALAYYFFMLEEEHLPPSETIPLEGEPTHNRTAPELFLLFGTSLVMISLFLVEKEPVLYILFFTSVTAAQLSWWKRSCSFRLSRAQRYAGIASSALLFAVGFTGYLTNSTILFTAGISSAVVFTLFSPLVFRKRERSKAASKA